MGGARYFGQNTSHSGNSFGSKTLYIAFCDPTIRKARLFIALSLADFSFWGATTAQLLHSHKTFLSWSSPNKGFTEPSHFLVTTPYKMRALCIYYIFSLPVSHTNSRFLSLCLSHELDSGVQSVTAQSESIFYLLHFLAVPLTRTRQWFVEASPLDSPRWEHFAYIRPFFPLAQPSPGWGVKGRGGFNQQVG